MGSSSLSSTYHIESLARGLAVLSTFSDEQPDLSLTDISQRLDLNKTTTFRLLSTLESLGYIKRDPQTKLYHPGVEVLRLGFLVLNNMEVRQIAAPYLRRLVDEVEETVNLAVLDNHEVVYIDRVGSKHLVNVNRPVGSRLPAYCTSTGKAMLAYLPSDQLDIILKATTWEEYSKHTLTSSEALKENLALIRERGFSDSDGEMLQELRDVSAPIFQHDGQVVAAVNISVPSHRVSYKRLIGEFGPKVVMTGWQISGALGYNVKRAA